MAWSSAQFLLICTMLRPTMTLPLNCEASYYRNFLSGEDAKAIYRELLEEYDIASERLTIAPGLKSDFGKLMFIDEELKATDALPEVGFGKSVVWSPRLKALRDRVEAVAGRSFHICVCIYYPDGNSGVDFHSDYVAFGDTNVIPSLSLGEERVFQLREKASGDVYEQLLEEGSMIIMGDGCQQRYEHALPTDPKYKNGRINLTFRPYGY